MSEPSIDRAPPTASPPFLARILALSAIVVAGLCGGLIGYAVTDLQCTEGCSTTAGVVAVVSAAGAAVGVAVVAVLTLRAMAEWNATEARDRELGDRP